MATVDVTKQPVALYLPPLGSPPVVTVCIEETHSRPVTFTKNPVEQGAPVTDHARPEPVAVTLKLMASDSLSALRTPDGIPYALASDLYSTLVNLQKTPALIRAVTMGGDYSNMGVDNVTRSIDVKSAHAVVITLTMHEIRIVKNKLTRVVVATNTKAQPVKKTGAVLPQTPDKEPQSLANQTAKYGADKLAGTGGVIGGFGDALKGIADGPK